MNVASIRPKLLVRPHRALVLALIIGCAAARSSGVITIKGKCPKCGTVFELPPRRKALLKVKCPNGHEVLRLTAMVELLKRGEEK